MSDDPYTAVDSTGAALAEGDIVRRATGPDLAGDGGTRPMTNEREAEIRRCASHCPEGSPLVDILAELDALREDRRSLGEYTEKGERENSRIVTENLSLKRELDALRAKVGEHKEWCSTRRKAALTIADTGGTIGAEYRAAMLSDVIDRAREIGLFEVSDE